MRLYNLNGIPVELQHISINYYNKSGNLISEDDYDSDDFSNIMLNNFVFDMSVIAMNDYNLYDNIDGSVEYIDINGNLVRKSFKYDLSVDDIPVKYVQ